MYLTDPLMLSKDTGLSVVVGRCYTDDIPLKRTSTSRSQQTFICPPRAKSRSCIRTCMLNPTVYASEVRTSKTSKRVSDRCHVTVGL